MDVSTLQQQLTQAGIDLSSWGTGEAKTLEHLQKEIQEGESELITDETGTLVRKLVGVGVDVYYIIPQGKWLRLKEEKQVFADGRVRSRNKRMANAVSEKMKEGEDPTVALVRGMKEELGIEEPFAYEFKGTFERSNVSQSYPGLLSHYVQHLFEVTLTDDQFRSEGYIEEQDGLTTYFVWEGV